MEEACKILSDYIGRDLKSLLNFPETYYVYYVSDNNNIVIETTINYTPHEDDKTLWWHFVMNSDLYDQFKQVVLKFVSRVDPIIINIDINFLITPNFHNKDSKHITGISVQLIRNGNVPCYLLELPTEIILYISLLIPLDSSDIYNTCKTLSGVQNDYYWLKRISTDYPCFNDPVKRKYDYKDLYKALYNSGIRVPNINLIYKKIIDDIDKNKNILYFIIQEKYVLPAPPENKLELNTTIYDGDDKVYDINEIVLNTELPSRSDILSYKKHIIPFKGIIKILINKKYLDLLEFIAQEHKGVIPTIIYNLLEKINNNTNDYSDKLFELYQKVTVSPINEVIKSIKLKDKLIFKYDQFLTIINNVNNTKDDHRNLLLNLHRISNQHIKLILWKRYNKLLSNDEIKVIFSSLFPQSNKLIVRIANTEAIRNQYLHDTESDDDDV